MSKASVGYVVSIVVNERPALFWKEEEERGTWVKNPQQATRSYSHDAILEKYIKGFGNSTEIPGFAVSVIEERVVTSVMAALEFERRRMRRIKMEDAD